MGINHDKKYYTYEDVTIMPNVISLIEHRNECIPLDENGMLPLFASPMNTVVCKENFDKFENEMIYAIMPRTEDIDTRIYYSTKNRWAAYSLSEFEEIFCNESSRIEEKNGIKALIDVANGHMKKVVDLVRASKNIYGDSITIMVGNIANPMTYEEYARVGADYIRCGIGAGKGCLTTSCLGVHVPMASLIDETVKVKNSLIGKYDKLPKIVADGGIRNYRDIIKALALGADYVMCGSVFAKMIESAAPKICNGDEFYHLPKGTELGDISNIKIRNGSWYGEFNGKMVFLGDITATFYGMASREGQIALNGKKTKTSEGTIKKLLVEYTMHGWATNFIDYLKSAMSYVGVETLEDFKKYSVVIINSENACSAVNK